MPEFAIDQPPPGTSNKSNIGVSSSNENHLSAGAPIMASFYNSGGLPEYQCSQCNFYTPIVEALTKHSRFHDPARQFQCESCNQRYLTQRDLKKHRKIHDPMAFECNVCRRMFRTSKLLTEHLGIHTGRRPYNCSVEGCGKTFLTSSHLGHHMKRVHTFERLHQCTQCDAAFSASSSLKAHMRNTFHVK